MKDFIKKKRVYLADRSLETQSLADSKKSVFVHFGNKIIIVMIQYITNSLRLEKSRPSPVC